MGIEVSDELVSRIARLSRLALSDEEREEMKAHFEKVLRFVEELGELDLSEVSPSLFSLEASDIHREDEPAPGLALEAALRNAPAARPPFFLVPRIVAEAGDEKEVGEEMAP